MVGSSLVFLLHIPQHPRPPITRFRNSTFAPSLRISINPRSPRNLKRLVGSAADNGLSKGSNGGESGNGKEDLKRDRRSFFSLRWTDLLDPDPENILAVGLAGLLTWASVQVLWQLFFISLAILVAALNGYAVLCTWVPCCIFAKCPWLSLIVSLALTVIVLFCVLSTAASLQNVYGFPLKLASTLCFILLGSLTASVAILGALDAL